MSRIPAISFPEDLALPALKTPTHPVVRYVKVLSRMTLFATFIIYLIVKFLISPAFETTLKRRFELHNFVYRQLKDLSARLRKSVKNPPTINVKYKNKVLVDRTISSDDVIMDEVRQTEYEYFQNDAKKNSYTAHFSKEISGKEVRFSEDSKKDDDGKPTFTDLNDKVNYSTSKIDKSLQNLKEKLTEFKVAEYIQLSNSGYNNGDPEMNSLLYQIKQFKTYLEVVTSEPPREMLFKKPISHIQVGRIDATSYKFNYLDILNSNIDDMKLLVDSK